MIIKDYGKVVQRRVMLSEDISGYSLWIDGYKHFIPREVLADVVLVLGQQLPPELGVFDMLAEVVALHFQKCAATVGAEGE